LHQSVKMTSIIITLQVICSRYKCFTMIKIIVVSRAKKKWKLLSNFFETTRCLFVLFVCVCLFVCLFIWLACCRNKLYFWSIRYFAVVLLDWILNIYALLLRLNSSTCRNNKTRTRLITFRCRIYVQLLLKSLNFVSPIKKSFRRTFYWKKIVPSPEW